MRILSVISGTFVYFMVVDCISVGKFVQEVMEQPHPGGFGPHEDDFSSKVWPQYNVPTYGIKKYPTMNGIIETSFRCSHYKFPGYYADIETACQMYHICMPDGRRSTFICGNGTVFSQESFVCDWWYKVDCEDSRYRYHLNGGSQHDFRRITSGGSPATTYLHRENHPSTLNVPSRPRNPPFITRFRPLNIPSEQEEEKKDEIIQQQQQQAPFRQSETELETADQKTELEADIDHINNNDSNVENVRNKPSVTAGAETMAEVVQKRRRRRRKKKKLPTPSPLSKSNDHIHADSVVTRIWQENDHGEQYHLENDVAEFDQPSKTRQTSTTKTPDLSPTDDLLQQSEKPDKKSSTLSSSVYSNLNQKTLLNPNIKRPASAMFYKPNHQKSQPALVKLDLYNLTKPALRDPPDGGPKLISLSLSSSSASLDNDKYRIPDTGYCICPCT